MKQLIEILHTQESDIVYIIQQGGYLSVSLPAICPTF